MSVTQPKTELALKAYDRAVLLRQTMNDQTLADEVLELFLQQLAALKSRSWESLDLNFEMHTLKGSAAALGAMQLEALTSTLLWRALASSRRFYLCSICP